MMKNTLTKCALRVGLAAVLALPTAAVPALAAPAVPAASALQVAGTRTELKEARWRGHRGHHRHGRWDRHHGHGWNPGAAIALGIVGSLIASGVSESAAYDAIERCDARFRSFERDTGLYTTYGGEKRLCPYLR
jgi:hypothetical protein